MRGCRSSGAGASHREPVVTAGRTGLLDQEADAFGKVALASSLQEGQVGNGEQDGLADRWFGVGARAAGAGSPAAVTRSSHSGRVLSPRRGAGALDSCLFYQVFSTGFGW